MSDPKSLNDPAFYQGEFWFDGGGVHTNSAIGNHWFYLVSEGASGINENNEVYDIEGIGIEKAADIVFLCNRSYLVPDSDYLAYFELSIQATEEIFGTGSQEVLSVKEAWKAVGLPSINANTLDLAITIPTEFERIETCQHSGFAPSQCIITNVGQESYLPTSNDFLKASFFSFSNPQEINIPLTTELLPGASISFSFDTLIYVDQEALNTTHHYTIEISGDQNQDNNTVFGRFKNDIYSSNAIAMIYASTEYYDCQTASHQVRSFVRNQGCESFEANQPFQLLLQDTNQITYWSETIKLDQDLLPGQFFEFLKAIPFTPEEDKVYTMTLEVPNSPFSIEPKAAIEFWNPQEINIDYKNDFENALNLEKNAQVLSNYTPSIYNLNQENYLMTSGKNSSYNGKPCFYPEGNLDGGFWHPVSGIFTFCADFSAIDFPVVEFDLIQYRNDNLEEPFEASSMMQLSWEGNGSGQEIIYGQEEGQIIHHKIPLPSNFSGQLEFKFVNYTGTEVIAADFIEYDLNLLDNLSFYNDPSLGFQRPPESLIKIYPNPVSQELHLENTEHIESIYITNIQGQNVYSNENFKTPFIDLNFLPDGYYWLTLRNEVMEKSVFPFVKITKGK